MEIMQQLRLRRGVKMQRAKFSTAIKDGDGERLPNIRNLVNSVFGITGVRYGDNQYGEFAIVSVENSGDYFVGQGVLVKQLRKSIEPVLENSPVIDVKLKMVKNKYYSFSSPDE